MKNKKKLWFLAFRYIVPADLEAFLERKAAEGWHIRKLGQWSSLLTTLYRGEPRKYRYVYDMHLTNDKDYKPTYEQFGWEFVGQMASCMIWRKEYRDERPEAFSDAKSLQARNRRTLLAGSVSFILFLLGALAVLISLLVFSNQMQPEDILELWLMFAFLLVLSVLMGWVLRKMHKNRYR